MAISTPTPHPDDNTTPTPARATDLVTFYEAAELLRPTGCPVTAQTLQRRAIQEGVPIVRRRGGANTASWSDLLVVHAGMFPPPARGKP